VIQLTFLGMLGCCCVAAQLASSDDPVARADVEHLGARVAFYVLLCSGTFGTVLPDGI